MDPFRAQRAKELRRNPTDAENRLWYFLRSKQIAGLKFRRQQSIGNYIVDFVSLSNKLIVEVDGGQHLDNEYDKMRDQWLKGRGFKVVRFWDNEVLTNSEGVVDVILQHCTVSGHPPLTPPLKGGE